MVSCGNNVRKGSQGSNIMDFGGSCFVTLTGQLNKYMSCV